MQATASTPESGLLRRTKLRHFLRTRRAQVTPEQVGLVHVERRRTPGLRREEVAALAGVGVSWYTWLEQGRDINVSEGVVNAVSDALMLKGYEREYLYRLAGHNPPWPRGSRPRDANGVRMRALVEGWSVNPAYLTDRYGRIEIASNSARSLFHVGLRGDNCLVKFFTDPTVRVKYPDMDTVARGLVAHFRAQAARFPEDPEFDRIAGRLHEHSPLFADLWDCHEVDNPYQRVRRITHPQAGLMVFDRVTMRSPAFPESLLTVYIAQPRTDTAERVRGLLHSHARALLSPSLV
ncbi:helix-turn-helix transcriptional regulator [Streptomyces sp. HNM0663]|uniref:Helix-turn-helix transcriptional regulator n=2 Tax=Streptomyces chengmaiensis TaxID=3040919 RepID=A0ABT6HT14_9ACTN|nr:helix-turn-helix transcriptional regulator [Streptomyces chengmaiensis]